MQAIESKFLSVTDAQDNRIKATARAGSITIDWCDDLHIEDNHKVAALALCKKFNWDWENNIVGGCLPNGNYCFVKKEVKE